MKNICSSYFF